MNTAIITSTIIIPMVLTGHFGFYNHSKKGVALNGHDVVAYFQNHEDGITDEGKKGSNKFSVKYKNVTYHFSSQKNKELFEANPEDYLPAYGGWCAWAMSYGKSRVPVNYDTFLIAPDANGKDRLYLFYNSWGTNTLKKWLKGDHNELVGKADATWEKEVEKESKKENH